MREAGEIHSGCRRRVTGERAVIRMPVACGTCGNTLPISLHMDGVDCRRCQTRHDHQAMLSLIPTRSVAA